MRRCLAALVTGVMLLTACGNGADKSGTNTINTTAAATTGIETAIAKEAPAEPPQAEAETQGMDATETKTDAEKEETVETTEKKETDSIQPKTVDELAEMIREDIDAQQDSLEESMKSQGYNYARYEYDVSTDGNDIVINKYSGSMQIAYLAVYGEDDIHKQIWGLEKTNSQGDASRYQNLKNKYSLQDTHITLNIFDSTDKTKMMFSYLDGTCTFDINEQPGFEENLLADQRAAYKEKLEEALNKAVPGLYTVNYSDNEVEIIVTSRGMVELARSAKSDSKARADWNNIRMIIAGVDSIASVIQTDGSNKQRDIVIKLIDPAYPDITVIEYENDKCVFDLGSK